MYEDKIVMLMPALCGCQGKPACDPPVSFCADHKDVYHAMRRVIAAERERCAKVAGEWKIPVGHHMDRPMSDEESQTLRAVRVGIKQEILSERG